MSDVKNRFNPDWLTGVFTTIIAFISVAALIYAHLQLKEAHEDPSSTSIVIAAAI
jgi:hypothetical protein